MDIVGTSIVVVLTHSCLVLAFLLVVVAVVLLYEKTLLLHFTPVQGRLPIIHKPQRPYMTAAQATRRTGGSSPSCHDCVTVYTIYWSILLYGTLTTTLRLFLPSRV